MSGRSRLIAFGTAGALAIAGIAVAVLVSGSGGQIAGIVLMSLGFGGAVLLVFYEVGLSEDHARAREQAEARRREEASRREAERRRDDPERRQSPPSPRGAPRSRRPSAPRWRRRP